MHIRQEHSADYSEISDLVKQAFATAPVKDGDEHEYVKRLRASKKYIPELALVAEDNGRLVGHIMLTALPITVGNSVFTELLLSPLCVALEHRRTGIGSQLVAESFQLARALGYRAVFVVGDTAYYARFGFACIREYSIACTSAIPEQFVQAHELALGALAGKKGVVSFD